MFFQVVALGAISNVVVDFKADKSVFTQCGGVRQLVLLSKSIESTIRVNAVWALKNLSFLVNNRCKEEILLELSTSTLTSLISGNCHSNYMILIYTVLDMLFDNPLSIASGRS